MDNPWYSTIWRKCITKHFSFLLAYLLVGCVHSKYETILTKPSSLWTRLDCETIIASAIVHNQFDLNATIRIFATPYYPSVITALSRKQQQKKHLSEEEYQRSLDQFAKESMGIYYDWYAGMFMDSRGNYLRDRLQIDSLLFLVTIENKTYPCTIPYSYTRAIADILDYPCYTPLLDDLENRIFLENDKMEIISPRYVWGRRGSLLMKDETLLVMFPFRRGTAHFLEGSENMYLIIKGFGGNIKLKFSLSMME